MILLASLLLLSGCTKPYNVGDCWKIYDNKLNSGFYFKIIEVKEFGFVLKITEDMGSNLEVGTIRYLPFESFEINFKGRTQKVDCVRK